MLLETVSDFLAKQSKAKLEAMERGIGERIADLKAEQELVARALANKGVIRPKTAPSPIDAKPAKRRKHGGRSTGSANVLRAIVQEQPERVWQPIEIINEAHDRGVTSNNQSIRVALRRLYEQGFLRRGPGNTGWQFAASQNGSAREPFQQTPLPSAGTAAGDGDVG
jgi:hypothetical protein